MTVFGLILITIVICAEGQTLSIEQQFLKFQTKTQIRLNNWKIGKCVRNYLYGGMLGFKYVPHNLVKDATGWKRPVMECLSLCTQMRENLKNETCKSFTIETDVNVRKLFCKLSPDSLQRNSHLVENSGRAYYLSYGCRARQPSVKPFAGTVRLVNGGTSQEGRLEVLVNNVWGTVCDDGFSYKEASVVCASLGYESSFAVAKGQATFGEGAGPIVFNDVRCQGAESSIHDCQRAAYSTDITNKCTHEEDVGVVCRPCERAGADVVFLLDTSDSITLTEWDQQIEFIRKMIQTFTIGPDDVQVGIATFSTSAYIEFNLDRYARKKAILAATRRIRKRSRQTRVSLGLNIVRTESFTASRGDRINTPNVLIVVSDGAWNRGYNPEDEATLLRQAGIKILVISFGRVTDKSTLKAMAGSDERVFEVTDITVPQLIRDQVHSIACGVDGGWSAWSGWTGCSLSCGSGVQVRIRTCINPIPSPYGLPCQGIPREEILCYTPCAPPTETTTTDATKLPVDGDWSAWNGWSSCSQTCGSGVQVRLRTCINLPTSPSRLPCQGFPRQERHCYTPCATSAPIIPSPTPTYPPPPPSPIKTTPKPTVDGHWTPWNSWSECSESCGNGIQYRERTCTDPPPSAGAAPCQGPARDERSCFTPCPTPEPTTTMAQIDGNWMPWNSWSDCSQSCGNGTQYRERTCMDPPPSAGGAPCQGADRDERRCFIQCLTPDLKITATENDLDPYVFARSLMHANVTNTDRDILLMLDSSSNLSSVDYVQLTFQYIVRELDIEMNQGKTMQEIPTKPRDKYFGNFTTVITDSVKSGLAWILTNLCGNISSDFKVGAMSFSHWPGGEFSFDAHTSRQGLWNGIMDIGMCRRANITRTFFAFTYAQEIMFKELNGIRAGSIKQAVIVIHGRSDKAPNSQALSTAAAAELKASGVEVFVLSIGVTDPASIAEITNYASLPLKTHVFSVLSVNELSDRIRDMQTNIGDHCFNYDNIKGHML